MPIFQSGQTTTLFTGYWTSQIVQVRSGVCACVDNNLNSMSWTYSASIIKLWKLFSTLSQPADRNDLIEVLPIHTKVPVGEGEKENATSMISHTRWYTERKYTGILRSIYKFEYTKPEARSHDGLVYFETVQGFAFSSIAVKSSKTSIQLFKELE